MYHIYLWYVLIITGELELLQYPEWANVNG